MVYLRKNPTARGRHFESEHQIYSITGDLFVGFLGQCDRNVSVGIVSFEYINMSLTHFR